MNDISVFIYFMCFTVVFGMTCVYMVMMMRSTMKDFNNPSRNVHPEMADVKTGEELLVFRSEEKDDDDDGDVIIIRK
mgnify:CR=1 FL=1